MKAEPVQSIVNEINKKYEEISVLKKNLRSDTEKHRIEIGLSEEKGCITVSIDEKINPMFYDIRDRLSVSYDEWRKIVSEVDSLMNGENK